MDQRGQKIDIVNRDAFASESNQSYKSVPFYMSSAGYGLFFHNYRPSTFDVGASVKSRLQLKASGGEMDFYLFVGAMSEILSQFTELTGRPAMLPLWAFGYHQGKATYRGREGLDVGQQMRAAQAAVRRHLLRRVRPGGDEQDLYRHAVGALPGQADGRIRNADVRDLARQRQLSFAQRPCRARLPHGRSQQSPGDRPRYQRRGRGRQKLRGVSRLFLRRVPWIMSLQSNGTTRSPMAQSSAWSTSARWITSETRIRNSGPAPACRWRRRETCLVWFILLAVVEWRPRPRRWAQHRNGAAGFCGKPAAGLDHDRRFGSDLCQFPRAYPRHAELDAFRLFQCRTGHRRLGREVKRPAVCALVRRGDVLPLHVVAR